MKQVVVKCPRCGKEKIITSKTFVGAFSCEHCNYRFELDAKTEKRIKIFGYVISGVLMLLFCAIVSFFYDSADNKILLVGVIVSAFVTVPLGNFLSTPFVTNVFGFSYEPVEKK